MTYNFFETLDATEDDYRIHCLHMRPTVFSRRCAKGPMHPWKLFRSGALGTPLTPETARGAGPRSPRPWERGKSQFFATGDDLDDEGSPEEQVNPDDDADRMDVNRMSRDEYDMFVRMGCDENSIDDMFYLRQWIAWDPRECSPHIVHEDDFPENTVLEIMRRIHFTTNRSAFIVQ